MGGLFDRQGRRRIVFDLDPTREAYRQRAVAQDKDRPACHRRAAELAAPGYTGRKRGEVVRSRLTVQQAHTGEWLGTYGEAGNGTRWPRLVKAADRIVQYLRAHGLEPSAGLLRFDGEYGWAHTVLVLAERALGYLMRCVDYRLLELPQVQRALVQTPQRFEQVDTGTVRQIFECGWVPWTSEVDDGATVTTRLVVARTPATGADKPKVGRRQGDWVYELFVTACGPEELSAVDVIDLYCGRGGFERTLHEEDEEVELDRWVSGHPHGQELWQILGQWVCNQRLQLGLVAVPCEPRCTLWSEALPAGNVATASALSATSAQEAASSAERVDLVSSPPSTSPGDAPVASAVSDTPAPASSAARAEQPAPSLDPASSIPPTDDAPAASAASSTPPPLVERVDDVPVPAQAVMPAHLEPAQLPERDDGFVLQPDATVLCPAHKLLRRVEVRRNRIRYQARAADCRACPKAPQCLRSDASGQNGRRLDWPAKALGATDAKPALSHAETIPTPPPPTFTPPPRPGPHPLYWHDLPATHLRRRLPALLWQQRVDGLPAPRASTPTSLAAPPVLTRDQRAHRRLSWSARLARNARPSSAPALGLRLYGVPAALAAYLGLHGLHGDG